MQLVSPVLIRWIVIYPVDSAIQRLNKQGQINLCPVVSAISFPNTIRWILIYPVDSAIQRLNKQGQINLYPEDNAISFSITYPLDSDLSGG